MAAAALAALGPGSSAVTGRHAPCFIQREMHARPAIVPFVILDGFEGVPRAHERRLRQAMRADLLADRERYRVLGFDSTTTHADARTLHVKISPVVRGGVRGVLATVRLKSGAIIARAGEIDASTGEIVRLLGGWGFTGRFAKPPTP